MKEYLKKYEMLDDVLRKHIFSFGLYAVFIFMCGVYFGLTYKSVSMLLFFLIISLLLCLFSYYRSRLCIDEKIVFADGEIIEIYNASFTKRRHGRNYIIIKQEDVYIKVYYHQVRKFKEHNLVRVYFAINELTSENRDTYICNNVFLLSKLKMRA